jgi:hypothetical protein
MSYCLSALVWVKNVQQYCCHSTLCFSFWQKTWIKSLFLVLLTCSCASEVLVVCGMLLKSLLTCSCANLDKSTDCDSAKGDLSDLNRRVRIQSFQQGFFLMWFGQVFLFNWFRFFWFLRLKNRPEPNKTGSVWNGSRFGPGYINKK